MAGNLEVVVKSICDEDGNGQESAPHQRKQRSIVVDLGAVMWTIMIFSVIKKRITKLNMCRKGGAHMADMILLGLAVICTAYFMIIVFMPEWEPLFAFIWLFFAAFVRISLYMENGITGKIWTASPGGCR